MELRGDGFLLAFGSARQALLCAIEIQRAFAARNEQDPEEPIRVRIGLHTGEVLKDADKFFGKTVILAARVAAQAEGGEILVSSLLKDLTESVGDIRFGEAREAALKGISETQRLFTRGVVVAMRCQQCGFENAEGLKFCLECGTPLGRSLSILRLREPRPASNSAVSAEPHWKPPAKLAHVPERAPRDYTPQHLADKILRSKSALEGERKQVTVLFADVKGSLELAERSIPRSGIAILDSFFQILTEGVHRYEGTISQYTGDGIMALFGAPIAHEDHAQRACYAALRLSDELRRYADELRRTKGLNFSVRMGLNSGEVVVGKIGDDLRMDYTAQGHTVGLAARMEQLAEPGKAYLTEHTAGWVEGFCRLGDLGSFDVKGVQESLRVFELQGVGPLRTRLEVAASRGLVRFVGRRREMEQLRRAWESAREGRGQIVAVVGEAGVGKSRLVYEFKAPLERGCRVLEAFSVSHGKAYAHLPLIDLLKGYFGIALEDDERQRREKITGKVLTLDRTLEDALPYLFSLLGIGDETASLVQMDPQIRRQRTLEAVKRVLVRETLDQPCVVIFEDLHWIDSETQAFLELLSESAATARLLLLVNYRPEYAHGWGSKTYYTQLRLDPLGEEEARELLAALLGEEASAEREALERLILETDRGEPILHGGGGADPGRGRSAARASGVATAWRDPRASYASRRLCRVSWRRASIGSLPRRRISSRRCQ